MIAPQILIVSVFLSFVWGWHLMDEIEDYREYRTRPNRIEGRVVDKMRGVVCALCLLSICVAYALRSTAVLMGLDDDAAGQIAFFTIIGINIPGAIFAIVSRKIA